MNVSRTGPAKLIINLFSSQDFESDSQLIPFADFGTVTFTDASYTADGDASSPSGATIFDVEQDGEVVTSCSASSSEVACTYE